MKPEQRMRRTVACAALLALIGTSARADEARDPSAAVIVLRHCVLECDQSTLLSSPTASVLQDRSVKLGDRVKAGQVLGRLFDQVARAEMEINAAEAESDVQIRVCQAELAQAQQKLKKTEALSLRHFTSAEELLIDRFAVRKAELAVEDAQQRRRIAQINRRRSEAELRAREFVSPHDGVVVGAFKNQGESVALHEPIFKIVNTARLKVWGALNVADLGRVRVGHEVSVRGEVAGSDLAVEHEVFRGRITFIDSQVDDETQTCKILAEVDNPAGLLRAGLKAAMEIVPQGAARTANANPALPEAAPRSGVVARRLPAPEASPPIAPATVQARPIVRSR